MMACRVVDGTNTYKRTSLPHRVVVSESIFEEINEVVKWEDATWTGRQSEISRWLCSDEAVGKYALYFERNPPDLTFYVLFTDLPTATAFKLRFA